MDRTGAAVASWLERAPGMPGNLHIPAASVRPAGGPWGPREEIPGEPTAFIGASALAAGGGAAVVGGSRTADGRVVPVATVRAAGGWGAPEEIPGRDLGTRLEAAGGDAPRRIAAGERPAGGSWAPLRPFTGTALPGMPARLAVNGPGAALALWSPARGRAHGLAASLRPAPGRSWTPAEDVAPPRRDRAVRSTSVAIDGAGRAMAAWSQGGRILSAGRIAGTPAPVRLTAAQLRTNQRIAQAAVRRANALIGRLEEGVAGGDIRHGALGAESLSAGVRTSGAETGALVPPGPPGELGTARAGGAERASA